jgi:hypothetical protein
MRLLKQSTAYDLMVFLTDSADHVAGKTGLTLTITASKAGAAFASISPTVTERGNGWYALALTTSHTDTVGDLALHITASGADPADLVMQVRANVLGDTLPANVTQFGGSNGTFASGRPEVNTTHAAGTAWGSGAITAASIASNAITAAKIATDAIGAAQLAADAVAEIQSGLATASNLATVAGYIDTEVAAILTVAVKLDSALESDGSGGYQFTTLALENAPSGGGSLTVQDIVDGVWDEPMASHAVSGSTGEALAAAGGAGDPWITSLPGSYTAGQAGYIVGNMLTAAGLRGALYDTGTAQAGGGSSITLESGSSSVNSHYNGREIRIVSGTGAGQARFITTYSGTTKIANVHRSWTTQPDGTSVYAIGDTVEVNVRQWVDSNVNVLVSGRVDATVGAMQADVLTASALATSAVAEIQTGLSTLDAAGVRSAVGLASANLDTQIAAIPSASANASAVWGAATRRLTDGTNIVLAKGTGVTGFNDITAASVWGVARSGNQTSGTFGEYVDAAVSSRLASASYSAPLDAAGTRTALGLASANLDAQLAAIDAVTDKLETAMEQDGLVYRFTANALEQAPAGGGGGGLDAYAKSYLYGDVYVGADGSFEFRDVDDPGTAKLLFERRASPGGRTVTRDPA